MRLPASGLWGACNAHAGWFQETYHRANAVSLYLLFPIPAGSAHESWMAATTVGALCCSGTWWFA